MTVTDFVSTTGRRIVTVRLMPNVMYGRTLHVEVHGDTDVTVVLHVGTDTRHSVYVAGVNNLKAAYVISDGERNILWVNGVAFPMTQAEGELVRKTLAPLGLRMVGERPATALAAS